MNNILISVVVPVHNREGLLDRCVDSLVYQSLHNFEIILVDDHSTDNSWQVMQKWHARFPEKIRLLKAEGKGVAYCKNTGIRAASGQYILFVDSDNYIDYKSLKRLYSCAEENNFPEMVYSPITRVTGASRQKIASIPQHETIADYLKVDFHFLHGKLFRADLFERFGCLPLLSIGEDDSWVFPVISKLTNIAYYPLPCYFYELAEDAITGKTGDRRLFEDILKGSEYIVEQTNPAYKERAILYAYTRIHNLADSRPIFKDLVSRYLYEHLEQLKSVENLAEKSQVLNNRVEYLEEHFCEIPQRIFVNGFGKSDISDELEKCAGALRETPEVIVLNENICDIQVCSVVADAYESGNFEFVGKYFAVKSCYEQGGIYIDKDIVIDSPFNVLLNDPAFFGFESDEKFTDKVFGCCAGNRVFEKILHTYDYRELYENPFTPLCHRIKTILVGMGNIEMISSMVRQLNHGFCIYPVDMFVYSLPFAEQLRVSHYNLSAFDGEQKIPASLPVLKALSDSHVRMSQSKVNIDQIKKDNAWLNKQRVVLQESVEKMEKDIDWLQNKRTRQDAKIESLTKDREWLQNKVSRQETKIESLTKDREWLQNKVGRQETKIESLTKDREWLQNKVSRQETKIGSLTKDREWLQNKVERQETKIAELEECKEHHLKKIEKMESNNRILQKKNERIQSSLDEFEASFLARTGLRISRVLRKIIHFFKF